MAKRLGERLIEAGLITAEALDKALQQQRITGHKLGDCLVEVGGLAETSLLRFLAAELKTRFVSVEKLSQAKIPTEVLDRLPVRLAEQQLVLPLAWDGERRALSVVMAEPQNEALLHEIEVITGAEELYAFIALRSGILASIRKHYYGDPTAFQTRENGAQSRSDLAALSRAFDGGRTDARQRTGPRTETGARSRHHSVSGPTLLRERGRLADADYIETLNILIGMLELRREHHRGHSALLARHAQQVARQLGLPPKEISALAIASYLHDLGKPEDKHFTLPSNAQVPGWKQQAKTCWRAPIRLFESVHLPVHVNAILAQQYEAFDGSGVPQGAHGEDITAGARILAAVDAYLDLTRNAHNGLRRVFSKGEALAHLRTEAGRLYDPKVVDALERLHSGELLRQRVANDGRVLLVAESCPDVRAEVSGALGRAGALAHGVASLDGVAEALVRGEADLLVVGLRFGLPELIALTEYVRGDPACAGVPIVVLGSPAAHEREMLLQYGVSEFVALPLQPDAAAQQILALDRERREHGGPARKVHGSFDELTPRDVLAVLARGRKSGRLTIQQDDERSSLQVERGQVVHVQLDGCAPAQAVHEIALLADGEFTWDANHVLVDPPNVEVPLDQVLQSLTVQQAAG